MNTLEKFKFTEGIKDRYTTMFAQVPEAACSMDGIDKSADLVVQTIEHFEDIKETQGLESALHYLVDVLGYYVILCNDVLVHNQELVELLKQKIK